MARGEEREHVSPFGKKVAQARSREQQRLSFRKNAGEAFTPNGEQQAILWQACQAAWQAGGTITLGLTSRGDALSVRIWRSDEPVLMDYLTDEDEFGEWLEFIRDKLGV